MTLVELGLVFITSIVIAFVILCAYIKALSLLGEKLRQHLEKIKKSRSDARPESKLEICVIYCFDKAYDFSNTYMSYIIRIVKDLIGNKPVSNYSHNSRNTSSNKNSDSDIKSPLSFHTDTLPQPNKVVQPKGNATIDFNP